MRETQSPNGRLHIVLHDPHTGRVHVDRWVDNLVTVGGRDLLGRLLGGSEQVVEVRLIVGGPKTPEDVTPAPAFTDTALTNPLRDVLATPGQPTERTEGSERRSVCNVHGTLPVGGDTMTLREAGLSMKVKSVHGGQDRSVLYNRVVFETITKQPNLAMTLTWELMF